MKKATVLAGRRIDPPDSSDRRFPLSQATAVRNRLRDIFVEQNVAILVSSAACGADLIAIDVALELEQEVQIVLPYNSDLFASTSVFDRPGDWAGLYWRAIKYAQAHDSLLILNGKPGTQLAYDAVTAQLFETARACSLPTIAIAVWDKVCRGDNDATCDFIAEAKHRDIEIFSVETIK